MNLFELFKPAKNLIMEGIDHPEDLIISQGSAGADRVLKDLASLQKDPSTVSIKWDGFPAVVFGRDKSGNLVFMDKHMYDKVVNGKMDFMSIKDYDESREANRANLWEKESVLRPALDKIIPNVKDQYWMGDLMWTGTPPTENGYFVFKPNTVEYRVKIDDTPGRGNTLSDQIARSIGGIAVHTFIPGLGQSDQPLIGLKGLRENEGVVFLVGEMRDKPSVAINPDLFNQTKQLISQHKKAVDKFIADLTAMKGKTVISAMGPFITRMLEEEDISGDIVPRFLDFLKERLTPAAAGKMLGTNNDGWLYQEDGGAPGLLGIWTMWAAITELKNHVKQQIDTQQQGSEIIAITDGVNAHEGYVFGSGKDKLKLIDRLGFSRANFAKHRVSPEEVEQKSKMPMASFCFGRMNPPTMGHGLVINKTLEVGGDQSFIFLSNSTDPNENPIDPATKAAFIEQIYPQAKGHVVTDYVQGPIYAANWLYNKGYRNMTFVAGSDRLGKEKGSIEKLLNSWNSGPIRSTDPAGAREHVVINFVSSGQRDPDAEGVTGYSGTKARQAAASGNEQQFQQYTGVGPDVVVNGKTLYQATREGMGIKDQPTAQPSPVKQPAQKNVQITKKVPGKAPVTKEVDTMNETPLRDKEDLQAKRKALQDIQMDPSTGKDPQLAAELARRKAALEKEAKKMNLSESIINSLGILEEQEALSRRLYGIKDLLESDYCDACDRPMKDCICDETNEARANTKAVRTGLSKREKRADPTMDAKKKSEQDAAWERLQAHMNKPENMAVLKRLATKESAGISKSKETEFHAKLDKLVHNIFGKRDDEVEEGAIKDVEDALARHAQRKIDHEQKYGPMNGSDLHSHELVRKQLLDKKRRAQRAYTKRMDSMLDEAPIEMDPQNPNDPMVMPPGLNPGKLSYRKSRAAAQLADLARMAAQANEKNSAIMWDAIVKHFPELETNIRSIQHGMQELEKVRRQGGIKSRGIDKI